MPGTRRYVIPLLIVFTLVGVIWAVIAVEGYSPRLGLDLRGGSSVTFVPTNPRGGAPTSEQLNTTVDIIRNRVNSKGVAESEVNLEGGHIVVSIPDVPNPDDVIAAVGTTAQLQFRPVKEVVGPSDPKYQQAPFKAVDCSKSDTYTGNDNPDKDDVVLCAREEAGQLQPAANSPKLLMGKVALGGTDIASARPELATTGQGGVTTGQWQTALSFSGRGGNRFQDLTGKAACNPDGDPKREIAITLDSVVINHPPVASDVQCNQGISGGSAVITGQTQAEAENLAPLISSGALPLKLDPQSRTTVSATLGADSLHAGLIAGAFGIGLVFLYVLVYYRGLGLVIWVGLSLAAALNLGIVILMGQVIGFTLTLAGIAGLIVAIGISADSYVVFFERIKDEVREGKTLRTSVDRAWQRSFHTLVSANTVSFAAAVVLYWLAIGPVRGFAFTLGLATAIDFFAAWFFARPAVSLLTRLRLFQEGRFVGVRAAV
ncbi:MAG TPA: protein translocase subunit SecD [Actinomycetota bacterium]|nr:protein translocase subunit SecD [Actinomycetota bacterium]